MTLFMAFPSYGLGVEIPLVSFSPSNMTPVRAGALLQAPISARSLFILVE
ncbi:hypothetical protein SAMN06298226_2235 [Nitrosovibrio sp. Nv4]|nr:hypothetical protein SAMN06298226_2235 [Nitrosovibrio sp. Nv4]